MTKIVFFGTEEFSAPTLQMLLQHPEFEVAAVVTKPDAARGRSQRLLAPAAAELAKTAGVKVWQPTKLSELSQKLKGLEAEVGVLVSYGKIIPQEIINLFPKGIINLHPSLLPKYRGPSPIESAIANQDSETGLAVMALSDKMDAGPIYLQTKVKLHGDETKPELYQRLATMGADILAETLPDILHGTIQPAEQDETEATYCQLLTKADGELRPSVQTAHQINAKVRAYLGWPKTRLPWQGEKIIVTKTKVLEFSPGDQWPDIITCQDETTLQILEVVSPKSGRTMSATDFLRGVKPQ